MINYTAINNTNFSENEKFYIHAITTMIVGYYEQLELSIGDDEVLIIKNPKQPNPIFGTKMDNPFLPCDIIYLCIEDYAFWCQVIYQLSHEYTHCLIYRQNRNKNQKVHWIEESICEVMSMVILKYFADQWNNCLLYKCNQDYRESIIKYLNDILSHRGNSRLTNCNGKHELLDIEQTCQENRDDRRDEVHNLYSFIYTKNDIYGMIHYKDFVHNQNFILNTKEYINCFENSKAIQYICNLQNNALKTK